MAQTGTKGWYELVKDGTGYRFVLRDGDNRTLMTGQRFASLKDCRNSVERFRLCAVAPVEDQTLEDFDLLHPPKYEIYKDSADLFRFRLTDEDGVLAVSEPSAAKPYCLRAMDAVTAAIDGAVTINDSCTRE